MNETLLDLAAIDAEFERVLGDRIARKLWLQQMLSSAMVSIITDAHGDFGASVTMTSKRILGRIRELQPHPEVPSALERLRKQGCAWKR